MPANIEIKARVSDPAVLLETARKLADSAPETILQTDTFFRVAEGRLKVREFADGTGELIFYRRPDAEGPKTSDFAIAGAADGRALCQVLSAALTVRGVVKKTRLLFMAGRTRMYEKIVKGQNVLEPGIPESFNVLTKELQSLGLDMTLLEEEGKGKKVKD